MHSETEDCPVCCESLKMGTSIEEPTRLICCGGILCDVCVNKIADLAKVERKESLCPLCRSERARNFHETR